MDYNSHSSDLSQVTYSCDKCEYEAKKMGNLKRHNESVHGIITYSCHQCDYKATKKGNLTRHNVSIHKHDRKDTWKDTLIDHIESIHGNVTYSCD